MGVSHSVYNSVCDSRSVFLLNRINLIEFTSFHQVIYFGFIRCEGKCLSHQHIGTVVENVILNKIILFIILFYFMF